MTTHPDHSPPSPHRARQPAVPVPRAHTGKQWPTASVPPIPKKKKRQGSNILFLILLTVGVLVVISVVVAGAISVVYTGGSGKATVAVIPIEGLISSEGGSSGLFTLQEAVADNIISFIEDADKDTSISAIVLKINSPGGTPVASEELARAVKETNKPTVAFIRDIGASGAYWVASSADWIIANRLSITGSVGVYASQLEFGGLLDDYNVTYQRMVAGKYKDIGTPYREMTEEEESLLQTQLDRMHGYFVYDVANNRGLAEEETENLATGMFYLGEEALELGLVDELGGKDEVINHLKEELSLTELRFIEYRKTPTFFESLGTMFASIRPALSGPYDAENPAQPEILLR